MRHLGVRQLVGALVFEPLPRLTKAPTSWRTPRWRPILSYLTQRARGGIIIREHGENETEEELCSLKAFWS